MPSIPPPSDGWRSPRPFVSLDIPEPGLYAVTIRSGATLRDVVDVVASLPRLLYIDHHRPSPGDSTVTLHFRALPHDLGPLPFGGV
ncbi:conserved hypothetical protein [Frankia canadensis]|uniref:Uncharacterized protein n=1 Tax=Frankia canadensis TaxID=1836972 RepID=A0A2I2KR22_9ACTN|nr:hypothetical protein [Frankia canadensis]SNQ48117.1 conserved hypothetical protein [Frankia canadensis]SOU55407.1 conserved hypothetical protein [Frankia canadensis]